MRSWIEGNPRAAGPYTRQRIEESYPHIESVLEPFADGERGRALDVGCGTAFNSFALAAHFDHVTAIDSARRRIIASKILARRAGVGRIEFQAKSGEDYRAEREFDFVYCNIMSDLTRSRRALIARMAAATAPGGDIFYAETVEGYAPRELDGGVRNRDARELRARLRQIVNGFAARPAFRFFAAGSSQPIFAQHGFEPIADKRSVWHGLPCVETLWYRATGESEPETNGIDHDSAVADPEFEDVRAYFKAAVDGTPASKEELEREASASDNRFAPFLLTLAMANEVSGARPREAGWVVARARDKGPGPVRPPEPDWDRVTSLFDRFRDLCAAREAA